jgi:hypothetical protein
VATKPAPLSAPFLLVLSTGKEALMFAFFSPLAFVSASQESNVSHCPFWSSVCPALLETLPGTPDKFLLAFADKT